MRQYFAPLPGVDLVVDPHSTRTMDPDGFANLGWAAGPISRPKMAWALPIDPSGPSVLEHPHVVVDEEGIALGDPDGNALGQPGVKIHRLLTAGWVQGTR